MLEVLGMLVLIALGIFCGIGAVAIAFLSSWGCDKRPMLAFAAFWAAVDVAIWYQVFTHLEITIG